MRKIERLNQRWRFSEDWVVPSAIPIFETIVMFVTHNTKFLQEENKQCMSIGGTENELFDLNTELFPDGSFTYIFEYAAKQVKDKVHIMQEVEIIVRDCPGLQSIGSFAFDKILNTALTHGPRHLKHILFKIENNNALSSIGRGAFWYAQEGNLKVTKIDINNLKSLHNISTGWLPEHDDMAILIRGTGLTRITKHFIGSSRSFESISITDNPKLFAIEESAFEGFHFTNQILISRNPIKEINPRAFHMINTGRTSGSLTLESTSSLKLVSDTFAFCQLNSIILRGELTELQDKTFSDLIVGESITIDKTKITELGDYLFSGMKIPGNRIEFKVQNNNFLKSIRRHVFSGLRDNEGICRIYIDQNSVLEDIAPGTFDGLQIKNGPGKMSGFRLNYNGIKNLKEGIFRGLYVQNSFDLIGSQVTDLGPRLFEGSVFGRLTLKDLSISKLQTMTLESLSTAALNIESCQNLEVIESNALPGGNKIEIIIKNTGLTRITKHFIGPSRSFESISITDNPKLFAIEESAFEGFHFTNQILISRNPIKEINPRAFHMINTGRTSGSLTLESTSSLKLVSDTFAFCQLNSIILRGELTELQDKTFSDLIVGESITIDKTKITELGDYLFSGMKIPGNRIEFKVQNNNFLKSIRRHVFSGLRDNEGICRIYIDQNSVLEDIAPGTFDGLQIKNGPGKMSGFRLNYNGIKNLKEGIFRGLYVQNSFDLIGSQVTDLGPRLFEGSVFGRLTLKDLSISRLPALVFESVNITTRLNIESCQNLEVIESNAFSGVAVIEPQIFPVINIHGVDTLKVIKPAAFDHIVDLGSSTFTTGLKAYVQAPKLHSFLAFPDAFVWIKLMSDSLSCCDLDALRNKLEVGSSAICALPPHMHGQNLRTGEIISNSITTFGRICSCPSCLFAKGLDASGNPVCSESCNTWSSDTKASFPYVANEVVDSCKGRTCELCRYFHKTKACASRLEGQDIFETCPHVGVDPHCISCSNSTLPFMCQQCSNNTVLQLDLRLKAVWTPLPVDKYRGNKYYINENALARQGCISKCISGYGAKYPSNVCIPCSDTRNCHKCNTGPNVCEQCKNFLPLYNGTCRAKCPESDGSYTLKLVAPINDEELNNGIGFVCLKDKLIDKERPVPSIQATGTFFSDIRSKFVRERLPRLWDNGVYISKDVLSAIAIKFEDYSTKMYNFNIESVKTCSLRSGHKRIACHSINDADSELQLLSSSNYDGLISSTGKDFLILQNHFEESLVELFIEENATHDGGTPGFSIPNWNVISKSIYLLHDTTPPQISIISTSDGLEDKIVVSFSDQISGADIDSLVQQRLDVRHVNKSSISSFGTFQCKGENIVQCTRFITFLGFERSIYTVVVDDEAIKDLAGNPSIQKSVSFHTEKADEIDIVNPKVFLSMDITVNKLGFTNIKTFVVTIRFDDAGSTKVPWPSGMLKLSDLKYDNLIVRSLISDAAKTSFVLVDAKSDGPVQLEVPAARWNSSTEQYSITDRNGNPSEGSQIISFIVDTTAPVSELIKNYSQFCKIQVDLVIKDERMVKLDKNMSVYSNPPADISCSSCDLCTQIVCQICFSKESLNSTYDIIVPRGFASDGAGNLSPEHRQSFESHIVTSTLDVLKSSSNSTNSDNNYNFVGLLIGVLIAVIAIAYLLYLRKSKLKAKKFEIEELLSVVPSIDASLLVEPKELKRSRIHPQEEIGEGAFGTVWRAIVISNVLGEAPSQAAIKALSDDPNQDQLNMFYAEAIIMSQLLHDCIVRIMGVCTVSSPKYLIMDYCDHGSLATYLHDLSSKLAEVSDNFRVSASVGVGMGMEYLESLSIVHRDLAARNILLDQTYKALISDFGLSRCIAHDSTAKDEYNHYRMTHGTNIPVRWTSPEALKKQMYTHASDMWSYGILLWEIWSDCATPYENMTNEQVWLEVSNGHRLEKPEKMSDEDYKYTVEMWSEDPAKRPTFKDVIESYRSRKLTSRTSESRNILAAALGEKVEEKTGLIGLSSHHINNVIKKFMKVTKAMTTTDVLVRMKSILKKEHTSYCNWASRQPSQISLDPDGSPGWGQASVFVSHAWKYPFDLSCQAIASYAKELTKQGNTKHHPGCVLTKDKSNKTICKPYFWFDIFTVNQFEASSYPQDFWTTTFQDEVRSIGHTLLILHPWDHPIPLTRSWCVWEMYCTLNTGAEMHIRQSGKDAEKLDRALAENTEETMAKILNVNTQHAEAWKESDRNLISEAIRTTVGHEPLNKMIKNKILKFLQYHIETSDTIFFEAGQIGGLVQKLNSDSIRFRFISQGMEFLTSHPTPVTEL
eukprot:UC4_evm4s135